MELCRTSNTGFQNNKIIEETVTTSFIEKVSTRKEYIQKFKEYKNAYKIKWKKSKDNSDIKYKEDLNAFVEDMKPYNKKLKNNQIKKQEYLKILEKRKKQTIY